MKYEQFVEDIDSHFSLAKFLSFDLLYHQCCSDKFQNSWHHCETIFDSDSKDYENFIHNQLIISAIKAEPDDINFDHNLLIFHVKSNIEKDLISNGMFI